MIISKLIAELQARLDDLGDVEVLVGDECNPAPVTTVQLLGPEPGEWPDYEDLDEYDKARWDAGDWEVENSLYLRFD